MVNNMSNWVRRQVFNERYFRDDPVPRRRWVRWCTEGRYRGVAQKIGKEWCIDLDRVDPETLEPMP